MQAAYAMVVMASDPAATPQHPHLHLTAEAAAAVRGEPYRSRLEVDQSAVCHTERTFSDPEDE